MARVGPESAFAAADWYDKDGVVGVDPAGPQGAPKPATAVAAGATGVRLDC